MNMVINMNIEPRRTIYTTANIG